MAHRKIQNEAAPVSPGSVKSLLYQAAQTLIGNPQLKTEFSAAAAHYDGLIDSIERAGWDLSKLERVKHSLDATAQDLLRELLDSSPDMTDIEQQSFLEPFHTALHQIAAMSAREKAALRAEYDRFAELHSRTLRAFATQETVE